MLVPAVQAGSPQTEVYFMHKVESISKESMLFSNFFFFFSLVRFGGAAVLGYLKYTDFSEDKILKQCKEFVLSERTWCSLVNRHGLDLDVDRRK